MNVWPKQKRAALLEWRGSTQSSSSEQGGSHGQYTRTEATATLPNKAVPIPTSSRFREAAPVSAAAAGTRSADTATVADDRTAGAAGAATADSGFAFRFHPPDLLPHRGLVAGGPPHRRQSHHSQCAADRRRVEHRSCLQLSSRLLALALGDVAAWAMSCAMAHRALRSRWDNLPGRRRNCRRASRQEGLRQRPASRCRAFVAFVHGIPLWPQVGRAGGADPLSVRSSAVGLAGVDGALPQQGFVEAAAQNTIASHAANAQSVPALVSRALDRFCRRRWLWHSRVGAHGSAAAATKTADPGQSVLRRRQSLCTPTGTRQSPGWTTTPQGEETAISRTSRGTDAAAATAERGLVRWWPTKRRSRHRHGPLVQTRRRLGRSLVGVRPRLHRYAPRRLLLHDRCQPHCDSDDRILYRSMVDRNDLPGNAILPWAGNDSGSKGRNRFARSPLSVRSVYGRGGVVRPDAGSR